MSQVQKNGESVTSRSDASTQQKESASTVKTEQSTSSVNCTFRLVFNLSFTMIGLMPANLIYKRIGVVFPGSNY